MVKICDILQEPLLVADLHAADKEGVLLELASHLCLHRTDVHAAAQEIFDALLTRERLGSTGVGEGVAIPHAKISGLDNLVACFGRTTRGVPFDAIDTLPVRLIFVLLVPENSAGAHLKALARISRLLKDSAFRDRLLQLPDPSTLYRAFVEEDARH
jgi:PTS system nitrogen regulatory IIA component